MKSSIYIASDKIQVIGYSGSGKSVTVKCFLTCPLPEGTVMNGKIIDPVQLTECLISMREERPNVFIKSGLIIDGSSIFSKRIITPKLNNKQYNQLLKEEFSDISENIGELVYDYRFLNRTDKSLAIFGCAISEEHLNSYMTVFKNAGIRLVTIRIGVQSVLNYVNRKPELKSTTFVLNIIDGVTMLSMIFDKGINIFISRTRLYGEDHEQLMRSVLNNLSGIIQFNKSEKFSDITCSYYLGLEEDDINFMKNINLYPNIKLDVLNIYADSKGTVTKKGTFGVKKSQRINANAHFAYLNILSENNAINLMQSYEMYKKLNKKKHPAKPWILAFLALITALSVPVIYLSVNIMELSDSIRQIMEFTDDESVKAKSDELDRVRDETASYSDINNQLNNKINADNAKASISNEILNLITSIKVDKVTVTFFDFNQNSEILRISARSVTETDSAEYVEELRKSDMIKSINYTGYSYDNNGEYNFSIDVKLSVIWEENNETGSY